MRWKLSLAAAGPGFRRPVSFAGQETQLRIPEGVLLGHALVARVADSLGIRVFFIKGPASVAQGLRHAKLSVDVDVFVDPSRLDELLEGLRERGWRERPEDVDHKTFPKHSVTVSHTDWPCCIDVHFRFPGMDKLAADCFEVLWADTVPAELAGQRLRVPTKALGILFLALHSLRSPELPAYRRELENLSSLTHQESWADELQDLATATGSLGAVRPFLSGLLPAAGGLVWPEPSHEWRNRIAAREPGSARLIAILQAPWKDKPRMLKNAVLPGADVFLSQDLYADLTLAGRISLHRARWSRFLRAIPRLAGDLRELRRTQSTERSPGR